MSVLGALEALVRGADKLGRHANSGVGLPDLMRMSEGFDPRQLQEAGVLPALARTTERFVDSGVPRMVQTGRRGEYRDPLFFPTMKAFDGASTDMALPAGMGAIAATGAAGIPALASGLGQWREADARNAYEQAEYERLRAQHEMLLSRMRRPSYDGPFRP